MRVNKKYIDGLHLSGYLLMLNKYVYNIININNFIKKNYRYRKCLDVFISRIYLICG